ncbi:hypothetical protein BDZ97DRAFT_1791546 [Flammula alnicola]|nr:hypothetical protein BDZ97DRAFT_1791546 [Flammula alnicola]
MAPGSLLTTRWWPSLLFCSVFNTIKTPNSQPFKLPLLPKSGHCLARACLSTFTTKYRQIHICTATLPTIPAEYKLFRSTTSA